MEKKLIAKDLHFFQENFLTSSNLRTKDRDHCIIRSHWMVFHLKSLQIMLKESVLSVPSKALKTPIRGEVVRIDLSLDTFGNEIDHLAIQDLLPAGLEIEFSNDSEYVRHREHRDDRFLIFPEAIKGVQKFTYFAKAVTAGEYVLPAPSVTCMYNSEIKSFGETGRIKIVESIRWECAHNA